MREWYFSSPTIKIFSLQLCGKWWLERVLGNAISGAPSIGASHINLNALGADGPLDGM